MKDKPKVIELPPTEYRADVPNKREPILGNGALEWGVFILSWIIVATGVHWAKFGFHWP